MFDSPFVLSVFGKVVDVFSCLMGKRTGKRVSARGLREIAQLTFKASGPDLVIFAGLCHIYWICELTKI